MSAQSSFVVAREQRRYKRYIVKGSVVLQCSAGESRGTLLNLGKGGVLIRSKTVHTEGEKLSFCFDVRGYGETFKARGLVVGTQADLSAIKFLAEPAGIEALLLWLDQENCTWSGTV